MENIEKTPEEKKSGKKEKKGLDGWKAHLKMYFVTVR